MTETSQTREAVERVATIHDAILTTLAGPFDRVTDEQDAKIMATANNIETDVIAPICAALSEAEERATKAEAERDTALARIAGMGAGEPVGWIIDGVGSSFTADPALVARWRAVKWKVIALYATPAAALARADVIAAIKAKIVVDASGLAPAVISHYIYGFEEAADAVLALAALSPAPTVKGEGE